MGYLKLEIKPLLSISIFVSAAKKFEPSSQVRYLGAILQDELHWNTILTRIIKKLSRSTGLLPKMRHYVFFFYINIYTLNKKTYNHQAYIYML